VLGSSGYVVLRPCLGVALIADVGLPCPPQLPAHAHADCLSFELHVNGHALIVDTGTSTYRPSARRRYERSTSAHNTVEVDGADQTEVWGTFRAARLAVPSLERISEEGGSIVLVASHDGYMRLPGAPVHRRTWQLSPIHLRIIDEVTGTGYHTIKSRLFLRGIPSAGDTKEMSISVSEGTVRREQCAIADGFGRLVSGCAVVTTLEAHLPCSLVTDIDFRQAFANRSPPHETSKVGT
jgi:hypothetical protein